MNPKVDAYLRKTTKWQKEMAKLRAILLDCQLTEEYKWGKPCYVLQESNVAIVQGFKEFCALLLPKGALLKDPNNILEKPGENTQAARRIRFTSASEIVELEPILKAYIQEAIEVEKSGLKVDYEKDAELAIPDELQAKFTETPALKTAFEALTPGRQRGYILHFSGAKQSATRASRIEKCMPKIFEGKGFHDS